MTGPRRPPRLMLVTSRDRARGPLPDLVARAVAGGVDAVQLREPDLPADARHTLASEVREAIAGRADLLINGDLDLAADLGAGVHLPEAGPDPATARTRLGPQALVGRSVHSVAAARSTGVEVDYVLAGHVYDTVSKPGRTPLGLDGLSPIVVASPAPVLAIGGITLEQAAAVMATGVAGLAVIGAITDATDPARAAADLRAAIDDAWEERMNTPLTAETATDITATINGKPTTLVSGTTVQDFISSKGFTAQMVIVELNGEILPRTEYLSTVIADGDRLEVVHAVGGG